MVAQLINSRYFMVALKLGQLFFLEYFSIVTFVKIEIFAHCILCHLQLTSGRPQYVDRTINTYSMFNTLLPLRL